MERTCKNTGLNLNIALNYGGRAEIIRATRLLAEECLCGKMKPEDIGMEALNRHMYTGNQPDIDLLIRTGGDERISNFMLWQSWYAELIFEKTYWPDYNKQKLFEDLNIFAGRKRRFGGLNEE